MIRSHRLVARRQVRPRDAHGQAVLVRRPGLATSGRSRKSGTTDGKTLAKLSDRPINLGVQDDTQPPPDPGAAPAAAGGGRGGTSRPASASSRGAPTDRASPTSSRNPLPAHGVTEPAAGRGGRGGRRRRPRRRGERRRRGRLTTGRGRPQRKDRVYAVAARRSKRRARRSIYENTDAHVGPSLLPRHADPVLQRARRAEHDRVPRST